MSAIWTTAVLVALLFPGIFFFIGVATYERFSREVIRSGAVSEIALATLVSLLIHIALLTLLGAFGFRLSAFVAPLADYDYVSHAEMVRRVISKLLPVALYLVISTACGIGLGVLVAIGIVTGPFRFLVKHKWAYDLIDRDRRRGITTVYVMTTTMEDSKVLMYRGRLHEFLLQEDGKLSYVILKDCARYYMNFGDNELSTGPQLDIFREATAQRRVWDYLMIDGGNIANILFDPSAQTIKATDEGTKALEAAVRARRELLERMQARAKPYANTPSAGGKRGPAKLNP
ncbi:hypothetical protein [Bradyrhizobium sp. BRP23]|uniref:hypothetical protein n=1 Tax=Bradyrhizobium sp. BRP23 TaxID=2793820 RepID=UPI001CD7EC96|nr:hypothetical protein [Bradyrhizobium sp. BRP23]MCA1386171.1 hypothetical protein [Bradyrhizobium sp. BRP05]MCA1423711.1 hypothetical protein [Bradyrhizobium sp. BRP23]